MHLWCIQSFGIIIGGCGWFFDWLTTHLTYGLGSCLEKSRFALENVPSLKMSNICITDIENFVQQPTLLYLICIDILLVWSLITTKSIGELCVFTLIPNWIPSFEDLLYMRRQLHVMLHIPKYLLQSWILFELKRNS